MNSLDAVRGAAGRVRGNIGTRRTHMGPWLHGVARPTEEIELNQAAAAPKFVATTSPRCSAITGGTERCYGAGGEDMATSSLDLIDGVPRCPAERLEQVPRCPGPKSHEHCRH